MGKILVLPDVVTYNAVISACEKSRQWEPALQVAEEMQRWAVAPDKVTYSTLISACGWGLDWEMALAYFNRIETTRRMKPDLVACTAAIGACGKASEWERSLLLLQETFDRGCGQNARTYNAAIAACLQ